MTKDQAVQRVLEIARAEIGYREKNSAAGLDDKTANAGGGNYTKYARDLDAIPGFYNGRTQSPDSTMDRSKASPGATAGMIGCL